MKNKFMYESDLDQHWLDQYHDEPDMEMLIAGIINELIRNYAEEALSNDDRGADHTQVKQLIDATRRVISKFGLDEKTSHLDPDDILNSDFSELD